MPEVRDNEVRAATAWRLGLTNLAPSLRLASKLPETMADWSLTSLPA